MADAPRTRTALVELRVLGPVRLVLDGGVVPLTAQQRTVLGSLAAAEGRSLSVDALATELWPAHPPASGLNTLRVLIRSIRRLVPGPVVRTGDRAYLLADSVRVDADGSEAALRATLEAAGRDDGAALACFAAARRIGEGRPYADLESALVAGERDALHELRLEALEVATDAAIRLGAPEAVIESLLASAAANPLRETVHERLVRALVAAGRRAEGVDAYARARAGIVDLLGIEPGPALRAAFAAALAADGARTAPTARSRAPQADRVARADEAPDGAERAILAALSAEIGRPSAPASAVPARTAVREPVVDDGRWLRADSVFEHAVRLGSLLREPPRRAAPARSAR